MKKTASQRLEKIQEYIFSQLEKEVKIVEEKSGRKVFSLAIGSPDIQPSEKYISELKRFFDMKDAHIYPGYGAITEFTEAIKNWYQKRFSVHLENDELYPLLGAKDGISHLPLALLDTDDEILIPNPGYPAYNDPTFFADAKPISYDLFEENNFKIDLKNVEQKITEKTKAIWINFPSNPTGQVITLEELKEIVAFAKQNNIFILYDNAYAEITFDGYQAPSILEIQGAKEIAIEIGSFSKTFSFAGFRMGWIVGNRNIIASLAKVKSQIDSGMSLPLQKLGAFALDNFDESWHQQMIETYKNRRDIVAKYLKTLGLTCTLPKGSLYLWAKIPENCNSAEKFSMDLLHEKQILLTPGTAFGSNGETFVRVSICANIDNIEDYF
jgi:LL-diaminopimelate aminotransferase